MKKQWFITEHGGHITSAEEQVLQGLCSNLFGYQALYIGDMDQAFLRLQQKSSIRSKLLLIKDKSDVFSTDRQVITDYKALPVKSDSIDLVVLWHVLDFHDHPHQIIREVERVLIAGGRLLIVNFSPRSLFGFLGMVTGKKQLHNIDWRKSISPRKLDDWLQLLGLEKEKTIHIGYRPPIKSLSMARRFAFLDWIGKRFWHTMSSSYAVLAVKKVSTITPIRETLGWRRKISAEGYVTPVSKRY